MREFLIVWVAFVAWLLFAIKIKMHKREQFIGLFVVGSLVSLALSIVVHKAANKTIHPLSATDAKQLDIDGCASDLRASGLIVCGNSVSGTLRVESGK